METTTLAVFAVFAAASFAVLQRVDGEVREPYMDEIFHVPQAQRYCKGAFGEWDPKLTTPPGLYVASLVLRAWGACTLQRLRLVNWALGLGLFWTIFGLIRRLHSARPAHAAACALTFSLLPTAFFFNHLYYTDTASLLCVLLAYLLSVRAQHAAASMVGFASLWMRQTNVVWVALIGATAVERWLRARGIVQADSVSQLVVQLCRWAQNPRGWRECTRMLAPYALVVLVFVAFVVANGGIVLGDKAHHQAGIHVPQMLYFYAFMCAMAAPTVLGEARNHVHAIANRPMHSAAVGLAIATAMAIGVRWFTVEHPFLLSDNRHYTFYVWKNFFQRHWLLRYMYIPGYVGCMLAVHAALRRTPWLWQLMWLVCTAAVLVPSPLLEFRYFTVPFYFARLHMPLSSPMRLAMEIAVYVAINAVTIWVFLYRPFTWSSEPGQLQRFMW